MNDTSIGGILEQNPYLAFQPNFADTLPIQLFVNGITFTLLCILLIHLLCKASALLLRTFLTSFSHDAVSLPAGEAQLLPPIPVNRARPDLGGHQMCDRPRFVPGHGQRMAFLPRLHRCHRSAH